MAVNSGQEPDARISSLHQEWLTALRKEAAEAAYELPESGPEDGESPVVWARRVDVPERLRALASAQVLDVEFAGSLAERRPAASFVQAFSIGFAREHTVLACVDSGDALTRAMPTFIVTVAAIPLIGLIQRANSVRSLFTVGRSTNGGSKWGHTVALPSRQTEELRPSMALAVPQFNFTPARTLGVVTPPWDHPTVFQIRRAIVFLDTCQFSTAPSCHATTCMATATGH